MSRSSDALRLTELLKTLVEDTEGREVSFEDLLGTFGMRMFGPLLLIPAIVAVAPTGAIPGMSLLTGLIIALISLQILAGRRTLWLPDKLEQVSLPRERLIKAVELAEPYAKHIDRYVCPRFTFASEPPFLQVVAAVCLLMAISMFPLALIPFAVALPGSAVAFLGLGLTARDGAMTIAGLVLSFMVLALLLGWYVW